MIDFIDLGLDGPWICPICLTSPLDVDAIFDCYWDYMKHMIEFHDYPQEKLDKYFGDEQ